MQTPLQRTELQLNFHQAATYYEATLAKQPVIKVMMMMKKNNNNSNDN